MTTINKARAFAYGLRDGWEQPIELGSSLNVDRLDDGDGMTQEWLDRGICVGQLVRAGRDSQTWQEGLWPVAGLRRGATEAVAR